MASLKAVAREWLNWPLFLSAAHLRRLKSPSRIQGPGMSAGSSSRHCRKGIEAEWSEGPYVLVMAKSRFERLQEKQVVRE